jgi:hypothetical protein
MPSQLRDPKTLADWLDLDYFRRARRSGRLWRRLLVATLLLSVGGVALPLALGRRSVFEARPVSWAHASFNQDCGQCHVEGFRTLARLGRLDPSLTAVSDAACTRCHGGPIHHETQVGAPGCASCHKEHRGHETLVRVADGHCTSCHAHLRRNDGQVPEFDPSVTAFPGRHPDSRVSRLMTAAAMHDVDTPSDPGTVRFNHAAHLVEEGVWDIDPAQGPSQGWRVHLECQSCHQPDATRRLMQPIRYESHCRSCHPLHVQLSGVWPEPRLRDLATEFGRAPAPHPAPGGSGAVVRGVLRDRLTRFILAAGRDGFLSDPPPTEGDDGLLAPARAAGPSRSQFAWVNEQQANVERLLFDGPGGCRYCHREKTAPGARPEGLPEYLPASIPQRWFTHARFDHKSHQMLVCAECHAAADSRTSADVLLPHLDTCARCHGPGEGRARADCVECHTYHDHAGRAAFRGVLTIER